MTKKQLKKLILASYTKNNLDSSKVEAIAKALSRSRLKEYIRALKSEENSKNVYVTIPKPYDESDLTNTLHTVFPDKKVILEIDPEILLGIRVRNNDLIYEENLKETLENMLEYLKD